MRCLSACPVHNIGFLARMQHTSTPSSSSNFHHRAYNKLSPNSIDTIYDTSTNQFPNLHLILGARLDRFLFVSVSTPISTSTTILLHLTPTNCQRQVRGNFRRFPKCWQDQAFGICCCHFVSSPTPSSHRLHMCCESTECLKPKKTTKLLLWMSKELRGGNPFYAYLSHNFILNKNVPTIDSGSSIKPVDKRPKTTTSRQASYSMIEEMVTRLSVGTKQKVEDRQARIIKFCSSEQAVRLMKIADDSAYYDFFIAPESIRLSTTWRHSEGQLRPRQCYQSRRLGHDNLRIFRLALPRRMFLHSEETSYSSQRFQ